ncbi:M15 family metallopeptidase [Mediterraneibacter catenae]|uniref:M15 family metallopeptidase n=1 Tax=Mediterraneibacter catenae TaxID=2594882 RepID=A0A5M9HZD3_9FIRM|nr:M15 family metallopeptidase [Mediterraneibacter catenae]KAA8502270.1 M15 family metallopeptidase [Mediterraneibacter catenae]
MIKFDIDRHKIKTLGAGAAAGLAAGILITFLGAYCVISEDRLAAAAKEEQLTQENEQLAEELKKERAVQENTETLAGDEDGWQLILVNEDHPLDSSYEPEKLTEISPGYEVDNRIVSDLRQMLDDGAAEGLSMYVTSAYRSYEQQTQTFNASMQNRLNQKMTPLEAYQETSMSVALPGTSEHATGLAVDIISTEYAALDDRQGDTEEQKWLMEHCWEYGFILRYPPEKSDITGIIYEPWHYRYVGKDAAKEITEQGITLEEYLGQ